MSYLQGDEREKKKHTKELLSAHGLCKQNLSLKIVNKTKGNQQLPSIVSDEK